jgi:hypothetical protein
VTYSIHASLPCEGSLLSLHYRSPEDFLAINFTLFDIGPYDVVLFALVSVQLLILLAFGACLAVWLALTYWLHITVVIIFNSKRY